ncbi:hypothetical protein MUK70_18955 [Dyadobacter chenwenxiniae]|uniref:Uncharacterized protein n=1 Tax=Dyadobacter chenwenxiniae TaxID=2906456 RepID=A0A9X1PHU6_9BACT|nr:hypothetical protein [Dyadobacter chenwenxiniae]MCF0061320.1 hypothetical protein [Dyadobacter chenwenxiniae]UON81142.1 hypothetical protein MUK70_18955 [Dyadobacter chenwenxiniae]
METNNEKSKEVKFPEGYEYFAENARFTASQLRQIDREIKDLPVEDLKQSTYRLRFAPPGLGREIKKWQTGRDRKLLETQKEEIEKEAMAKLEKDMEKWGIDPETADRIRTATIDTHNPNIFREMNDKEFAASRQAQKDLNHSQNYMRTLLEKNRETAETGNKKTTPEKLKTLMTAFPRALFSQRSPSISFQKEFGAGNKDNKGKTKSKESDRE